MGIDVVGIAVLALVFVVGTWRSINLGALSLVAAVALGTGLAGVSLKDVYDGFPADLFVLLVGVTFLFGVATANGTVDWIVDRAAHLVGHHSRALPWVLFAVAAVPSTAGALGPASIAILAPLGLRVGQRYNINPVLTSLMIVHGSAVGNFSPVNVLGAIVNQTMQREGLPSNPLLLFLGNLAFNVLLGLAIYVIYGRALRSGRGGVRSEGVLPEADSSAATVVKAPDGDAPQSSRGPATVEARPAIATSTDIGPSDLNAPKPARLTRPQVLTSIAVVIVLVGALGFRLDIGVLALVAAVVLRLVTPTSSEGAEKSIAWGVVLLICGIVTYVSLLQHIGTIKRLGEAFADMRDPAVGCACHLLHRRCRFCLCVQHRGNRSVDSTIGASPRPRRGVCGGICCCTVDFGDSCRCHTIFHRRGANRSQCPRGPKATHLHGHAALGTFDGGRRTGFCVAHLRGDPQSVVAGTVWLETEIAWHEAVVAEVHDRERAVRTAPPKPDSRRHRSDW